jgi:hypothetical protein
MDYNKKRNEKTIIFDYYNGGVVAGGGAKAFDNVWFFRVYVYTAPYRGFG